MSGPKESLTCPRTAVVVNRLLAGAAAILFVISTFGEQAESREQLRSYKDGDVMIGMLLPMHTKAGDDDACSAVSIKSIFVLEALLWAIRTKNLRGRDMKGMQIGYDVRDTCFSISTAMKQALNFVANVEEWTKSRNNKIGVSNSGSSGSGAISKPHSGFPLGNSSGINNTLCHEKPIMGIIGASGSSVSIAVAGLLSLYKIPMVSYFSTSTALSDTYAYPSFYRTIPSDDKQTVAMAEMITRFKWNYISTIATDNEYGREGIEALKGEIAYRNICLARDDLYDPTAGPQQVESIIRALKEDTRVKVVILFMYWQHAKSFLDEAFKQNLTGITWIASESWSATSEMLQLDPSIARGIIGVSVPSYRYRDFEKHVQGKLLTRRVKYNPWLSVYAKEKFKCNLVESSKECPQTVNDTTLPDCPKDWTLSTLLETNETLSVTVNAANALISFIEAMNLAIAENETKLKQDLWVTHEELTKLIGRVNFVGAGGESVRFDANGDFVGAKYHILNVQQKPDGRLYHERVGEWSMGNGHGELIMKDDLIQWNEGTIPISRCSAVCQPGYLMQPSPSECCWDCQKCPKGEISNSTQSTLCYKCDMFFHTNDEQSKCIANDETWIHHFFFFRVAGLLMGTIGTLSVLIILVIVIIFRKLAVIRRTELKYTFLVVTLFGQLYPFLHILRPDTTMCALQLCFILMPAVLQAVILMCQTDPALLISGRILHLVFHKKTYKRFVQIFTFYILGFVGIGFCMLTFATGLPSVVKTLEGVDMTFLSCQEPYTTLGIIPVVFQGLLLMLAAFFFERVKASQRHNAYNGISCYILVLIAAVTIPVYVTVTYKQPKILILTIGNSIGMLTITCLKFLPQMYDIFVKHDRRELELDIQVDTDTSQMSHPETAQKGADTAASAQQETERDSKLQLPDSEENKNNPSIPMTKLNSPTASGKRNSGDSDHKPRDSADVTLQVPEIIVDHDDKKSNSSVGHGNNSDSVDVVRDSRESLRGSDLQINGDPGGPQEPVPVQVLNSYDGEQSKNEVFV